MIRPADLLRETPQGLWCEPDGFFIDPASPAVRALITRRREDALMRRAGLGRAGPGRAGPGGKALKQGPEARPLSLAG